MTPAEMNKKLDRKRRVLAVWYVLLAAVEDVETQRRGFCCLVNTKTVKLSQVRSETRGEHKSAGCVKFDKRLDCGL